MLTLNQDLFHLLREVLGPMIWADQGELYLVKADDRTVALHLRGRFSGCPGNTLVVRRIIEPLISTTLPNARVILSSGYIVPEGASLIAPEATTPAPA